MWLKFTLLASIILMSSCVLSPEQNQADCDGVHKVVIEGVFCTDIPIHDNAYWIRYPNAVFVPDKTVSVYYYNADDKSWREIPEADIKYYTHSAVVSGLDKYKDIKYRAIILI